jgi:hypothetical protein
MHIIRGSLQQLRENIRREMWQEAALHSTCSMQFDVTMVLLLILLSHADSHCLLCCAGGVLQQVCSSFLV